MNVWKTARIIDKKLISISKDIGYNQNYVKFGYSSINFENNCPKLIQDNL